MSTLRFALVPSAATDRQKELTAFGNALSSRLGRRVQCRTAKSYDELRGWLQTDTVQFAWMSPLQFVLTQERLALQPLAVARRNGRHDYRSVLFARARSTIKSLNDCKGKRAAWVDPQSASGYLYPRIHLAARGLIAHEIFANEEFAGTHAQVVERVLNGEVDVGATYATSDQSGSAALTPAASFRIIEYTAAIPNDVIAAHGLLAQQLQDDFAQALAHVAREDGELSRALFETDQFTDAAFVELQSLRQLIVQARQNGLLLHL
jgi:phosphate/phosphite/phosphonate ABC transporter binding protein